MATTIGNRDLTSGRAARGFMADQSFFTKFTIGLALLIVFGFAQFAMRGFVNITTAPLLTHLHGAVMVAWLGIAVLQNVLVHRGELAIHRQLGWLAVALVAAIAVLGVAVGFSALEGRRGPPFFSDAYFLALTMIEPVAFAAVVAWGVSLRRNTQWHRRAMLGANVIILEPALGRLLPMPLMGGWGEWVILTMQLLALGLLARHDRVVLGRVHNATLILMAMITTVHLAVVGLSCFSPFIDFADGVAAG